MATAALDVRTAAEDAAPAPYLAPQQLVAGPHSPPTAPAQRSHGAADADGGSDDDSDTGAAGCHPLLDKLRHAHHSHHHSHHHDQHTHSHNIHNNEHHHQDPLHEQHHAPHSPHQHGLHLRHHIHWPGSHSHSHGHASPRGHDQDAAAAGAAGGAPGHAAAEASPGKQAASSGRTTTVTLTAASGAHASAAASAPLHAAPGAAASASASAAAATTTIDAAGRGAAYAAAPSAVPPRGTSSGASAGGALPAAAPAALVHPVLNNGAAVKAQVARRGYATAVDGTSLFYEVYECDCTAAPAATGGAGGSAAGAGGAVGEDDDEARGGWANVLLIMGFAAGRDGWLPMIDFWLRQAPRDERLRHLRARFAVFDNRGIGDSDAPAGRASYSTSIGAADAVTVMDALRWRSAHVLGFSMGGMVALKLAAADAAAAAAAGPAIASGAGAGAGAGGGGGGRVRSLTVLSVTGGGWQAIPTRWRSVKMLLWAAAARTPRQRAAADVHFHFCPDTLHVQVPHDYTDDATHAAAAAANGTTASTAASPASPQPPQPPQHDPQGDRSRPQRRVEAALVDEYVATASTGPPQPAAGLLGQLHAVWSHSLSGAEAEALRRSGLCVKVLHGYHDLLAMPEYGERTAKQLRAAFVQLNGGHFLARECAPEVCFQLADSIVSARRARAAAPPH